MNGFARCVTHGCEEFGSDRPIVLEVSETREVAQGMAGMVITANQHVAPVNDTDLLCPECEQPCALVTGAAPKYPRQFA